MNKIGIYLGLTGVTTAVFFGGCGDLPGERIVLPIGGAGSIIAGAGTGEECSGDSDCRLNLACVSNVCEPAGTAGPGEFCYIGPECADGLQCVALSCAPEGDGQVGDACETDLSCQAGLRCSLVGFATECVPAGDADFGKPCVLQTDCFQGLYCKYDDGAQVGTCTTPEPPLGVPLWQGVDCPEPDDDDVVALFSVPGADGTPSNATFFDLPYPNDLRLGDDGRPDLEGFPTPGPGLLGVDMVARYVDAVEEHTTGFSTNTSVIFRFSGAIDYDSVSEEGGARRIEIVDLDGGPSRTQLAYHWKGGSGTNYVCDDWIAVRFPRHVLLPGHQYVVFLTDDIKARNGEDIPRSAQFADLMSDTAPSDPALEAAYELYAPVRALPEADSIINAAVFTTDEVLDPMRNLADAVEAAAASEMPTASDWVKCENGVVSPCSSDDDEDRECGDGTADYDEYHALLEVPIFQEGTAPYLTEGGGIAESEVRREQICISMTIPTSAAPAGGWPLVIYGHGTGGNFRGPVRGSIAGELSRATPAMATLGFDQVQHGPRRGTGDGSDEDPETLFFNFLNPDAARGNPLQGAADLLSIVAWAGQGTLASASDTGDVAIEVDPTKTVLYGHSQGSTHGSIGLPFTDLPGAVLSGNGGGLAEALLHKQNPIDIAGAIPFVVQDADDSGQLRMGEWHPVLVLLQHYIDAADPLNFAALATVRPEEGRTAKHVFQTFGLDDTYSPPATLARYIYAAGLTLAPQPNGVNPSGDNELVMTTSATPVSGNLTVDTTTVTAVCRQYNPESGSDGHFVVDEVTEANADAIGFLEAMVNGAAPTVPVP